MLPLLCFRYQKSHKFYRFQAIVNQKTIKNQPGESVESSRLMIWSLELFKKSYSDRQVLVIQVCGNTFHINIG